jgi:hypothetical protein
MLGTRKVRSQNSTELFLGTTLSQLQLQLRRRSFDNSIRSLTNDIQVGSNDIKSEHLHVPINIVRIIKLNSHLRYHFFEIPNPQVLLSTATGFMMEASSHTLSMRGVSS